MKTNFRKSIGQIPIACFALLAVALPDQTRAQLQFTGDYQTNTISGTAINWPSNYYVGSNYVSDALFILNGGSLSTSFGYIGRQPGANSNLVVVSGNGSAWTNSPGHIYVGEYGSANRLVISDGGKVVTLGNTVAGSGSSSISNSILVTGSGSVLTNGLGLTAGDGGAYCSLVISNGGAALCREGYVGGIYGRSNIAIVTGSGSVWSNRSYLEVGANQPWNTLIVSNGGAVFSGNGYAGSGGCNNSVLITGSGSLWRNSGTLYVGYGLGGPTTNNSLAVANGGSVLASNVLVSYFSDASNGLIHVSGGNLTVTNLSATGFLDVRRGTLTFNSGTIIVDQLRLTYGVQSILEFNSGTLHSKGTLVSNTQPCVIGDGFASANFHLLGGVHSFNNGLRIRASGLLSGCGTVNGNLLVDAGGAVVADCGSPLVFNGSVTNNGILVAKDSSVLQSAGTVVNNGTIFLVNGGTTNFSGTFINNGAVRYSISPPQITGFSLADGDVVVQVPSIPTFNYFLQASATLQPPAWTNSGAAQAGTGSLLIFTEPGGATIGTNRFYRIGVQ
jgi:T5SS/PEP-CTERM-associated repeat protein